MLELAPPHPDDFRLRSRYRYPRRYAVREFDSQMAELRTWFPRIDPDAAWRTHTRMKSEPLPPKAEGLFLSVSPTFFGRREAGIREVVAALREQRRGRFRSYLDGKFDAAHLRLRASTSEAMMRLLVEQTGDVWVLPAQFGGRHRGKTYERHLDTHRREFNLGLLSVASMLLAHPLRFVHDTDLHVNCGGEQLRPAVHGAFSHTPFFQYERGKLRLGAFDTDVAFPHDGAATGFA